uniref:Uncharacterized protein n=1 Tax=Rhizophora mucronata TaxID=61149 RepID=A0A2P2NKD6_RHIMU
MTFTSQGQTYQPTTEIGNYRCELIVSNGKTTQVQVKDFTTRTNRGIASAGTLVLKYFLPFIGYYWYPSNAKACI